MDETAKRMNYVIRKNGQYLVAIPYPGSRFIRWSTSPYDGARLHEKTDAKEIANKVGGIVAEFNPMNGAVIL